MPRDPLDLNAVEVVADCGDAALASHRKRGRSIGANTMRSVLALGLLMSVCASANAAGVHHSKPRRVIVLHSHNMLSPRFVVPPVKYDDTPSYNDPSKFGGGAP
jgi:hypothetical protein